MRIGFTKLMALSGILIQTMTIAHGFAAGKPLPRLRTDSTLDNPVVDFTKVFPWEMTNLILGYWSLEELRTVHQSDAFDTTTRKLAGDHIRRQIIETLGELILLPPVTAQDLLELSQAGIRTSITQEIPAFRAAKSITSVELYLAVMGHYPDILTHPSKNERPYANKRRSEIIARWEENLDLPIAHTTSAEDVSFAQRLSEITGRRFFVMTNPQNEYSIRGRDLDADGKPTGKITTTLYYFGEWHHDGFDAFLGNFGRRFNTLNGMVYGRAYGVREALPGFGKSSKTFFWTKPTYWKCLCTKSRWLCSWRLLPEISFVREL